MKVRLPRACALGAVIVFASVSMTVGAQTAPSGIPGPNVNIIGPTPDGAMVPDNTLKQKNEPLCAVRPNEPRQFFCVYNDYRGVDKPTIGDSWIGASMTRDEGLTWLSRLVPGFPNSPGSLNQAFAADPGIVAVPGMALVNFLAANRDGKLPGGIYLQRWVELNKEDGFPWAYADTRPISSGTAGQFRDKPALLVTLAPKTNPPAAPLSLQLMVGGQPVTQRVAAGEIHVAYANFTGNDPKDTSQIRYLKSSDYGNTWSKEVKLSASVALSQGVALAANGDTLVAVWRQFDFNSNQPHSLVYAVSMNRGNSWSKASTLGPSFICPFDQVVSDTQFRTDALPTIVSDGSRFFVLWAQRQGDCATGQSRIVYVSSTNGKTWNSQPTVLDNSIGAAGHQYMPAASAAGGVVQVVWYDTRDDEYYPSGQPRLLETFISDTVSTNPADVDPSGIALNRRHTADVYQLQIKGGIPQVAVKVSQYAKGTLFGLLDQQLERNFVNARMFQQGKAPFNGDYISAAAPAFRLDRDGAWISNNGPVATSDIAPAEPTFQVAWADNRHVRSNVFLNPGLVTGYTEPQFNTLQGEPGNNPNAPKCVPGVTDPMSALSRNQRVLSSVIKPGVLLSAATPSKSGTIQRAHVIVLQNLRDDQGPVQDQSISDYQLQLTGPSAPLSGGDVASFSQFSNAPTNLDVSVPEGSSVARTVFVAPGPNRPAPAVLVQVFQCVSRTTAGACVPAATPSGSIVLNGNATAGALTDPDCTAAGTCYNAKPVQIFEAHNPVLQPDAYAVANPSYRNPSLRNPSLRNQTYESPSLRNETVQFPSLRNPSLRNTPLDDAGASAEPAYTDFVYTVTNTGNITTAYNLKPLLTGDDASILTTQLIVTKVYPQPTAQNCGFTTLDEQQVLVNIVNPNLTAATTGDPLADPGINAGPDDATFLVEPGGSRQVTLRVWGVDITTNPNFARRLALKVYSQSKNTDQTSASDETPNDSTGNPDTTKPTFSAASLQGPFEADVPGGWAVQYTKPTATDCATPGCANPVTLPSDAVSCSPPSGQGIVLGVGTQAITCVATDLGANTTTAEFRFEVRDTTPPVLSPLSDLGGIEATGPAGAVATFAVTAMDRGVALPAAAVVCTPTSGSTFPVGSTTINCTATDTANLTSRGSFKVTVVDTTSPVVTVPANVVAEATGPSGAIVNYAAASFSDTVGVMSSGCTPVSGSVFALGTTTVTCSATDAALNNGSGTFTVKVQDTTPPTLTVPANITSNATGSSGAVVSYAAPAATDAVDTSVTVVCASSPTAGLKSGSTFPIGTTTVSCVATDDYSNTTAKSFTVTVNMQQYGFVNLNNLPPAAGVTFKPSSYGTLVDFQWSFTSNNVVVNSLDSLPSVTIVSPSGASSTFTKTSCSAAQACALFEYISSGNRWHVHWQPKNAAVGTYYVVVSSAKTGQRFPAAGSGFPIVFKK
jgi:hypothetical protein